MGLAVRTTIIGDMHVANGVSHGFLSFRDRDVNKP